MTNKLWGPWLPASFTAAILLFSVACGSQPEAGAELKGLTQAKLGTLSNLEAINGQAVAGGGTVTVPRGATLVVAGWATDSVAKLPASRIYVELDGKVFRAEYGIARPDVAAALKDPAFTNTGFTAAIPSPEGTGEHRVTVDIVGSDNKSYYTGPSAVFVLR